ncbi:MAG TPA: hypothetical protein H9851_06845 [Candidatus Borkfalkia faecavium]|uniref:Uncharacterized protein n=1 Tax=Candidatus Borkfalkia faecavium TaxID=2838508 RepID=A0A9D1W1J4_9FIRM|nr:hypothetical protein [Candidatus Borkfalkia faecavium]
MDRTNKRVRGRGAGMSKFWQRAFVFAAAFLLLLFASNDFGLIDIQKTAIVLALGVDASAQEGLLDVTAQIGSADANGAAQASNITIEGVSTVGEAIARLNRRTGWYPTFVHCRLLLLGGQTAERDVFGILDYFLRSEYIEDSCLVALCAGRAQAALEAGAPGGELTANAIAKVFSGEAQKTGLVSAVSLREFAKGYYGAGASGRLPYLTLLQEAESGPPQGSGQGAASASGSDFASAAASVSASGLDSAAASAAALEGDVFVSASEGENFVSASGGAQPSGALAEGKKGVLTPCASSSGGQGDSGIGADMLSSTNGNKEWLTPCAAGGRQGDSGAGGQEVFDVSQTALFAGGKKVGMLRASETLAVNLAEISTDFAYAAVRVQEEGAEVVYQLKVRIEGKKKKLRIEGGVPVLSVRVRALAQVIDAARPAGLVEVAESAIVPAHVLRAAEEQYRAAFLSAAERAHAAGCDLFSLHEKLRRHFPRQRQALAAQLLEKARIVCDVRFDTLR